MEQSLCPNCGRTVALEAVFCPKCGTQVSPPHPIGEAARRPSNKSGIVLALLAALVLMGGVGLFFVRSSHQMITPPVDQLIWTQERMDQDPRGYCVNVRRQFDDWIGQLTTTSNAYQGALDRVEQADIRDRYDDAKRIYERMTAAHQRAMDENRWPVKLAGTDFNEKQAAAVMARTREYIEKNRAAFTAYLQAVERLEASHKAVTDETEAMRSLRAGVDQAANQETPPGPNEVVATRTAAERLENSRKQAATPATILTIIDAVSGRGLEPLDLERILKQ